MTTFINTDFVKLFDLGIMLCSLVLFSLCGVCLGTQDTFASNVRYQPAGLVDPDMPRRHDGVGEMRQRVQPFNPQQKKDILDLHNYYRNIVTPPASNMRFMTWDDTLEYTARQWAEGCVFDHGMPEGADKEVGQNLYMGPDREGLKATFLWYNETYDFHFPTNSCRVGKDVQCGHYTQMVWDDSHLLGCAIAGCINQTTKSPWNHIVCHYKPGGNSPRRPYSVGAACSGCRTNDGGLCTGKLCITKDECEDTNSQCGCPLKCHNCGTLSRKSCKCNCKPGWDSLDCSRPCQDSHHWCGVNPGYPNHASCRHSVVKNELCRLMCRQCPAMPHGYPKVFFDPDVTGETGKSDDVCCRGTLCPAGYVLDTGFCECVLLCPGPLCSRASVQHSLKILAAVLLGWVLIL